MTRDVLRNALNLAVRWGYLPRNAAALSAAPRRVRRPMRALDEKEARALLTAVVDDRLEALYAVALAVGLRQGEALGLRWRDLDLDAGTLAIRNALQRTTVGLVLVEPKSETSRRLVDLPAITVESLRRHRARQIRERLVAGDLWDDKDFVFSTARGRPLDPRNVLRQFKRRLQEAGLPDMRFHDLRHSCATLLLAQGVPARAIQELLGHSQISLTLGTYSHVTRGMRSQTASAIDAILGPAIAGEHDENQPAERGVRWAIG